MARRVAHQSLVCIASPDYLARAGTPRTPTELDDHEALLYRQRRDGWIRPGQLCTEDGPVEHAPSGSMTFSDGEAMAHAAVLGMGIAQVSSYMAMEALASGALVELLPHCRPPDMPIHAVMPEQSSQLARVRLFLDALAQAFEHP